MTKSDQTQNTLPHDLILEGREKLSVTGVNKVLQCDAENAVLDTSKGTLRLRGASLSIESLDIDKGEVKLTGRVDGLEYTDAQPAGGFWRRLLR